jgi:predicted dehydrogenase
MGDKVIRIGIIGCGSIANAHVQGYQTCTDAKITSVADSVGDRAQEMGSKLGAKAYSDYHEMLKNEELDGVSICTPPAFHKEIAIAALNAGVNVLCEKPLAINAAEAREMVDAAEKAGKLLVAAFCHRFHEPVMIVRSLIEKGALGKVVMFRNRFGGKVDFSGAWFSKKELAGGGTVMDTSVHSIDLFRYLVGEPNQVTAMMQTVDSRISVEDCNVIVLKTAEGAIGTIEASWATPSSANVIEVYGSDGTAIVDYSTGELRYLAAGSSEWQKPEMTKPSRFVLQARHFVDCLQGNCRPIVTGFDGLRAAEVIDAAYQSTCKGLHANV